jgi:hypothetical protein
MFKGECCTEMEGNDFERAEFWRECFAIGFFKCVGEAPSQLGEAYSLNDSSIEIFLDLEIRRTLPLWD